MKEFDVNEVRMDLPASMYLNYLARRKADHTKLTAALSSGHAIEEFKVVGHQIKGNASSFGFDDLVSIGERMEALSNANLKNEATELLAEFWRWIVKTEARLASGPPEESGS